MSAFVLEDGVVHHRYSAYARGTDVLWGMYQRLDRAPKGRNETGPWLRHRDEYAESWPRTSLARPRVLLSWLGDASFPVRRRAARHRGRRAREVLR
jgi:hypothetical protein